MAAHRAAKRQARLAELGFTDMDGYLQARRAQQGWSLRRMRAELRVRRAWLEGELDRLGSGTELQVRPGGTEQTTPENDRRSRTTTEIPLPPKSQRRDR